MRRSGRLVAVGRIPCRDAVEDNPPTNFLWKLVMFLENVEITNIYPCLADPSKIRILAKLSADVTEVLPYLNAVIDGGIYNHAGHTLTIKKGGRLITVHPNQIAAGKILDEKDAREILNWLKDLINDCYEKRDTVEPLYERRQQLGALDTYKLLPGTNCKKCGELTCLAFAVKLINEQANVMACDELFSGRFNDRRDELLRLLRATGYRVPDVFSGEGS
ncbi:MAG: Fe-S cluster protein [candidate division KSB1 bacterium]|nr:Fe-S cluster protein [candidate division KSB1 bacterium]